MKLPNLSEASVRELKIVDYLLSATHKDGKGKAGFFIRFGFDTQHWRVLAEALITHASAHEVAKMETSAFGVRYIIEGEMETPDGRKAESQGCLVHREGRHRPCSRHCVSGVRVGV